MFYEIASFHAILVGLSPEGGGADGQSDSRCLVRNEYEKAGIAREIVVRRDNAYDSEFWLDLGLRLIFVI